jgi:hypothetical protein
MKFLIMQFSTATYSVDKQATAPERNKTAVMQGDKTHYQGWKVKHLHPSYKLTYIG